MTKAKHTPAPWVTQTYQGWSNYETWAINLWFDNDHYLYEKFQQAAEYLIEQKAKNPIISLADSMKDYMEDEKPVLPNGVFCDLLTHAFGMVDWYAIAKCKIEDAREAAKL